MKKHEKLQEDKQDFLAEHGIDKLRYKDGKGIKTDTVVVIDTASQKTEVFKRDEK